MIGASRHMIDTCGRAPMEGRSESGTDLYQQKNQRDHPQRKQKLLHQTPCPAHYASLRIDSPMPVPSHVPTYPPNTPSRSDTARNRIKFVCSLAMDKNNGEQRTARTVPTNAITIVARLALRKDHARRCAIPVTTSSSTAAMMSE